MMMIRPAVTLLTILLALLSTPMMARAQAPQSTPTQAAATPSASDDSWRQRIDLFVGLDGSKQPQDLGINANMGLRVAGNVGVPMVRRAGVGVQLGVGLNAADAAVHVLDQVDGTSRRTQLFATLGVFQRLQALSWGIGYDVLRQNYFDDTSMTQLRGEGSIALGSRDEVGAWFTAHTGGADATIGETRLRLAPITQVNALARHTWPSGARTGLWVGVARGHHNVVLVFPDNSRDRNTIVYGAELSMPLNDRWAVTGATNLMTPTATGTVDAFMGVTFSPGGRPHRPSTFAPVLGVANNTSFSVDLSRP